MIVSIHNSEYSQKRPLLFKASKKVGHILCKKESIKKETYNVQAC